ncbi:peptidase S8 [Sinomonas cellulolyticus]|uniref:S8 family serine peptidase n=1 Tax=Sinomonas cellulolyticus TaxID=2801916 RepID=A0ABS1K534_9MICC|nr:MULTISPECIES: S8 family serine peptidase [Sinomonas]MBL0705987.1 S8 family serine peptidase [Sinomonas cellulolyticus]GHG42942.1 peptidase S8 [Sinomonas sp. KCTC 49339]
MKRQPLAGAGPRRQRLAALAVGLPLAFSALALPAHAAPDITPSAPAASPAAADSGKVYPDGRYIVVLAEEAVAAYDGGTPGYAATKPETGRKVDAGSPSVKAYDAHLRKAQRDLAGKHGISVGQQYTTALNGFTADLTGEQAARLAKDAAVLTVAQDEQHAPDYTSNDFMKLTGQQGAWATQFGGKEGAGKGTVVGVIDTGYTPDNPFLAGEQVGPLAKGAKPEIGVPYLDGDGTIAMLKGDGQTFKGECQKGTGTGASFDGSACDSKVLSARYFADAFLKSVPPEKRSPEELISPVDVGSHGTHTASTAAGNADVKMSIAGTDFGVSSGVAPAAKVAVYKVCWEDTDPNTGGCYSSASVQAIEAAILDGVDVLNYSISGNTNSTTDPVALAFLNAASAGIFVANSAGNSGPTPSTVNHAAPWVTSVAASTFPGDLVGTVLLSDGSKYRGATVMSGEVTNKQPVIAADAALPGAADANLCLPETLDPAKVSGKIVICDRGVNARVEKSAEVKRAGGVGMVLVNLTPSSEDSDLHSVPTIHVNAPEGPELKGKVAADPTLTLSLVKGDLTGKPAAPAPQIAGFSSRGPSLASGGDLLKPDISAPGVNVLAGVSPIASGGEQFGFMSGTSMASPHIAGVGALVLGKNPTWTPAMVKSAMMTTAYPLVTADGAPNRNPFDGGAGHVDTTRVTDPGLVYNAGAKDWNAFISGQTEAKDVNLPSIALGSLVGEVQVKRQITALVPGLYRPTVNLPGIDFHVEPQALNFSKAGQTREVTITIKNISAQNGKFTTGSLSWVGPRTVTSPIAIRPVEAKVSPSYSFSSATGDGSGTFTLTSGSDSPIPVGIEGLAPVSQKAVTKVPGSLAWANDASNGVVAVTIPAGQKAARFVLNAANDQSDWDLYVLGPNGSGGLKQFTAATGSASESLVVPNPIAGTYYVIANLFASPGSTATDAVIQAAAWAGDAGNATVAPNPIMAANGTQATETLSWNGLSQGAYMGRLSFGANGIRSWVDLTVGSGAATAAPAGAPSMASVDSVPGR